MVKLPNDMSVKVLGARVEESFWETALGKILQALFQSSSLYTLLSIEQNPIYYDMVDELLENGKYFNAGEGGLEERMEVDILHYPIVISPSVIKMIFPDVSNVGMVLKPTDKDSIALANKGYKLMRGNDARETGTQHKKSHHNCIGYGLAEIIDKCLLCKSGASEAITEIQLMAMSAIWTTKEVNWCQYLFDRFRDAMVRVQFVKGGKGSHYMLLSHIIVNC